MNTPTTVNHASEIERRWVVIRQKMESFRKVLECQGYLAWKPTSAGRRCRMIRFRQRAEGGPWQLRTICLGTNEEINRRAAALLSEWQSARLPERSPVAEKREAWRTILEASRQYGRADRRSFVEHFRAASSTPRQMFDALADWPGIYRQRQHRKRGGRPRRAAFIWPASGEP